MMMQLDVKTASVNGTELHFVEQGAGDPLIFVHGAQGDYRNWLLQLAAFGEKYRVISYSRRYHYPNAWTGDGLDYTVSLHADDLISLIETLVHGPTNVVGNSFGAYTTLLAATRRPDLLRKIVIGEPPILPWLKEIPGGQADYDFFMKNAWLPAKEAFQRGEMEQGLRLFMDGVSSPGTYDHLPDGVRARFMENVRELQAETLTPWEEYMTPLTREQVARIGIPTLLVRGQKSPVMFHKILDRLAEYLPAARLATIPNASHAIASGNPQEYNRVVMEFLR